MACIDHLLANKVSGGGDVVLGFPSLQIALEILESTRQVELGVDALNSVSRVDVLDQGDLEASGATLSGDDGGVGKEVLPDLCRDAVSAKETGQLRRRRVA